MSLNALAISEKILVRRGCLEGDEATLTDQFLADLELLPEKIEEPWQKSSWEAYNSFLKTYGSHVITSVTLGASFRQMIFAESSESYSERDFEVKSCLSLAGPTAVGEVGFKACADISQSEKSKASQINTSDKVFVLGGNPDTRNKLLDQKTRSVEEIQNLLNEGNESPSSIEHTFVAIWNILQSRFKIGSPNHYNVPRIWVFSRWSNWQRLSLQTRLVFLPWGFLCSLQNWDARQWLQKGNCLRKFRYELGMARLQLEGGRVLLSLRKRKS